MNPQKADFGVGGYRHRLSLSRTFGVSGLMARGPGDDGSTAIDEEEGKRCEHVYCVFV